MLLEISLADFEQWVYSTIELEKALREEDYIDLIALNYKGSFAFYELKELLLKHIDYSEYQTYHILSVLKGKVGDTDITLIIDNIYDLQNEGYYFLRSITDCWLCDESTIKEEMQKMIDWIESGKIVITKDSYEDYRSEEEKQSQKITPGEGHNSEEDVSPFDKAPWQIFIERYLVLLIIILMYFYWRF